jgi:hypothetical protein
MTVETRATDTRVATRGRVGLEKRSLMPLTRSYPGSHMCGVRSIGTD